MKSGFKNTQQNRPYDVIHLLKIVLSIVSPTTDKIKDKLLGRVYKACCDLWSPWSCHSTQVLKHVRSFFGPPARGPPLPCFLRESPFFLKTETK